MRQLFCKLIKDKSLHFRLLSFQTALARCTYLLLQRTLGLAPSSGAHAPIADQVTTLGSPCYSVQPFFFRPRPLAQLGKLEPQQLQRRRQGQGQGRKLAVLGQQRGRPGCAEDPDRILRGTQVLEIGNLQLQHRQRRRRQRHQQQHQRPVHVLGQPGANLGSGGEQAQIVREEVLQFGAHFGDRFAVVSVAAEVGAQRRARKVEVRGEVGRERCGEIGPVVSGFRRNVNR